MKSSSFWINMCLVSSVGIFTSFPAAALLDEPEISALRRVYDIYKKQKTVGDLLTALDPQLDSKTSAFLRLKTKSIAQTKLPPLNIRTDSRIGFKFGSNVVVVDFISLRSDMILINSREVEFLPDDSIETRWNKLLKASERKSASLHIFEGTAYADDGTPLEGMSVMRTNIGIVNALALSMEAAAKDQTQCSSDFQNAYTTCVDRTTLNQPTFALTAPAASTTAASCSPTDTADLTQAELAKVKAMKSNPAFAQQGGYFGDRARVATTAPFKEPQVSAMVKDGSMDLYLKWKLQTVRNAVQSLPTGDTDANCKTKLNTCLHDLISSVKGQTSSASLKCYMDKVASDIAAAPRSSGSTSSVGSGGAPNRPSGTTR